MQRSIVVVGAGPAGMAAALEACARGSQVTVIDEAALPGGQIYRQAPPALNGVDHAEPAEVARKHALLDRFVRIAGQVDYRAGATAYALFANGEVHVAQGDATEVLRPDAIVLATGVRELAIPFPGWTLPGVMLAGGAQAILKSQRVVPGKTMVIAGCGPLPVVVAAQMIRAGATVAALANLHPLGVMLRGPAGLWHGRRIILEGLRYAATVLRARAPRLTGHVPIEATGSDQLEAVVLARVDDRGRPVDGTEREVACDVLAVNYGFVANSELAAMAGARMRRDPVAGGWLPEVDQFGRSSVPGLFVAGDGGGLRGALVAECEGRIVGAAAAARPRGDGDAALSAELEDPLEERRRHMVFQKVVRRMLRLPPALWRIATVDTVVCRCENVSLAEVCSALETGQSSLNAIKRNVRTGMGWCGGRICLPAVAALTELHAGSPPGTMMTPRPMARPVSFAALARRQTAGMP